MRKPTVDGEKVSEVEVPETIEYERLVSFRSKPSRSENNEWMAGTLLNYARFRKDEGDFLPRRQQEVMFAEAAHEKQTKHSLL